MLAFTWTKVGAERPLFLFSGGSGLNFDLGCRNDPLENYELFITRELADLEQRNR
jgi:hypothetical protein